MTTAQMEAAFERYDDEYLKFQRIQNPMHRRPDLCAFLMLDVLFPTEADMVAAAEHDELYLEVPGEAFRSVASDELIRDLVRCGVRYAEDHDCLVMWV